MTAPFFSVIINAYNGERFVGAAIDSMLAQNFDDFECVFWDDCSTDGTAAIGRSYADPRIRHFASATNLSIGRARSAAIAEARGDWLAFLDQDDLWTPDKLARQHRSIMAGGPRLGLVYGRTLRFDDRGALGEFDHWHRIGHQPEGDLFTALLRHPSFVALSSAVVRREAVERIGGIAPHVDFCPDYYLFLTICRDWLAACIQTPVCHYRVHPQSMSRTRARQIHAEAFRIGAAAARPTERAIIRRRATITDTLLAWDDIRSGHVRAGMSRLIGRGSLAYLVGRPFLRGAWRPALQRWAKR